jgi:hypothetical protein
MKLHCSEITFLAKQSFRMATEEITSFPPRAIASVILSTGLLAIGNGLLFAFIPV